MRPFVAAIIAIGVCVALPCLRNAQCAARATEIIRFARDERAIGSQTINFVASISAIRFAVTTPRRVDALSIAANELMRCACRVRAIGLVAFIETIDFAVTTPRVHVARRRVCAFDEHAWHAGALVYRTADFVGRIGTVLILVTAIIVIDALSRRAFEMLTGAITN